MPLIDKPVAVLGAGPNTGSIVRALRQRYAAQPLTLVEIDRARRQREIAAWNADIERKKFLKKGRK